MLLLHNIQSKANHNEKTNPPAPIGTSERQFCSCHVFCEQATIVDSKVSRTNRRNTHWDKAVPTVREGSKVMESFSKKFLKIFACRSKQVVIQRRSGFDQGCHLSLASKNDVVLVSQQGLY
jgi:hypothetical protein